MLSYKLVLSQGLFPPQGTLDMSGEVLGCPMGGEIVIAEVKYAARHSTLHRTAPTLQCQGVPVCETAGVLQ